MSGVRHGLLAVVVAWTAAMSAAQAAPEVRLRVRVEPEPPVYVGETVRLVVEVEGASLPRVTMDPLPPLENLEVVSGPETRRSTSFQFDGTASRASAREQWVYTLQPLQAGQARIPSLTLRVGSKAVRTDPLGFEVRPGRRSPGPSEARAPHSSDVELVARAEPREAWVGQPVAFEVVLYARAAVGGLDWVDTPSFSNFWVEDAEVDPTQEARREERDGRAVTAYPLIRKILVPTASGRFTLDPYVARVEVRRRGSDPFGDFFSFRRFEPVVRRSEPVVLDVRPLPRESRPAGFSGAVGRFRVEAEVDRPSVRMNEAVQLTVRVEGEGFLASASAPALEGATAFKVFDPDVEHGARVQGGRLHSWKRWQWVLVPLRDGALELPTVRFHWFDPFAGEYASSSASPGELVVQASPGVPETGSARRELRPVRRELAYIRGLEGGPLRRPGVHPLRSVSFYVWTAAPWAILAGAGILLRRRRREGRPQGVRAGRAALRRLRRLARRGPAEQTAAFHEEIARVLVDYVAAVARRPAAGLTYDDVEGAVARESGSPELAQRFRRCLEQCDLVRFAPDPAAASGGTDLAEEAVRLVREVEARRSGRAA